VDRSRTAGAYEGALRSIIQALKYEGRRALARPLAALLSERASEMLSGTDAVVPVPLHDSRQRERGFNQSADLAGFLNPPTIWALRRTRATLAQAELPAARRHANVRGAFTVTRHAASLKNRVVTLVDDVSTTGATLEACARALKAAGVREVRAVTAARALFVGR
jgi:ComF family protein